MQYDKNAIFADNQKITQTAVSENTIPTGADIANGTPVPFAIEVTEAFNNLTNLRVMIETCANETFASDATTTIYEEVFERAKLVEGAIVGIRNFPANAKQFCREKFVVTGSNPTTGAIKSGVVTAVPASYEDMQ